MYSHTLNLTPEQWAQPEVRELFDSTLEIAVDSYVYWNTHVYETIKN